MKCFRKCSLRPKSRGAGWGAVWGAGWASADAEPNAGAAADGVRVIDSPDAQPVDLMDAAGGAVAKRLVPVLAGVTILVILIWLFRRKKS